MSQSDLRFNAPYDGSALIADPIHQYVSFTVPFSIADPHERTEKDLIDSPWVQRLRYIYQLQSARWVYPSAEHTRFVHSLGTMHVAGRFARHLYPFLKKAVKEVPSAHYVEEFLRVTALAHDIGHGPFCHFFDDNYLHAFDASHEKLGQIIIAPSRPNSQIWRSLSGPFAKGEELNLIKSHMILMKRAKTTPAFRAGSTSQPVISSNTPQITLIVRAIPICGVAR
jgi:HD superfamily phosphohydrolase